MKVSFENCGEVVSLSDFAIVVRIHTRFPDSFSGWIFLQLDVLEKKYVKLSTGKMVSPTCFEMDVHFELVRMENMSRTFENLIEMTSPTCFEIVAQFHEKLLYSFLTQIFLQFDVLEKEDMKFDVGMIVN